MYTISGALGMLFMAVWLSLGVVTIFKILRNDDHTLTIENQVLWVIVIIVVPIIGPLVYWLWKSSKKPEA